MPEFCHCGRALTHWTCGSTVVTKCLRHGYDFRPREPKETRPKYSGKSKRGIKGKPEDY